MKVYENIAYKETDKDICQLDVYLPDADVFPVFVYFHGGGLQNGTRKALHFYAEMAKKGIAVATVDYRMYPDAVYPDFIKDAAAAVAWVYNNMEKYGAVTKIFVGGSSAGGYLSQMLCFDKKYLALHGIDADELGGYIHDAGQPTTHFNVLRERGIDTRRVVIDAAAPIYHITENRAYAPMQIIVSDMDMENRLEQTDLLVSTLRHFGYNKEKLDYRLMKNSRHCSYIGAVDEDGNWIFVDMIHAFIIANDKEWAKQ